MNFIKKYWQILLIGLLIIIIGIMSVTKCSRPQVVLPSHQQTVDSIRQEKEKLNTYLSHYKDSIAIVIKKKQKDSATLSQKLVSITNKYTALRNTTPDHDTVVRSDTLLKGQECCEKLPVVQQQLEIANSMNVDERNINHMQAQKIGELNNQLDASLSLNNQQIKENKDLVAKNHKLERKVKVHTVLNWIAVGVIVVETGIILLK